MHEKHQRFFQVSLQPWTYSNAQGTSIHCRVLCPRPNTGDHITSCDSYATSVNSSVLSSHLVFLSNTEFPFPVSVHYDTSVRVRFERSRQLIRRHTTTEVLSWRIVGAFMHRGGRQFVHYHPTWCGTLDDP